MNLPTKQKQTHRLREQTYSCQWGMEGGGEQGVWDLHVHTAIFKMDNQQGPVVQHMELSLLNVNVAVWTGGEFEGE